VGVTEENRSGIEERKRAVKIGYPASCRPAEVRLGPGGEGKRPLPEWMRPPKTAALCRTAANHYGNDKSLRFDRFGCGFRRPK